MTLDELKVFVDAAIDERLTRMLGHFELPETSQGDLTWDEIRQLADQHRWTPPPGAKSSQDFLREDRRN
ncbi:MAG: hypothetical protein H7X77_05700 [Anaerolineae bacterium]|nr:hypothetical protein [Anaerolineae bacterium]